MTTSGPLQSVRVVRSSVENRLLYSGPARVLSLLLASGLSLWVLLFPSAVAQSPAQVRHGLLALAMWGIAAGFVHGVGYVPQHAVWRVLLGPLVALPLMLASVAWLTVK